MPHVRSILNALREVDKTDQSRPLNERINAALQFDGSLLEALTDEVYIPPEMLTELLGDSRNAYECALQEFPDNPDYAWTCAVVAIAVHMMKGR